jgi:hypothetical protein
MGMALILLMNTELTTIELAAAIGGLLLASAPFQLL